MTVAKRERTISRDREGNSYVLRVSGGDVRSARVELSDDHVLQLAQSAPGYRQDILERRHPGAVYATPATRVPADWDALGENILIQVQFPASGHVL
jgi:hypothetical protein